MSQVPVRRSNGMRGAGKGNRQGRQSPPFPTGAKGKVAVRSASRKSTRSRITPRVLVGKDACRRRMRGEKYAGIVSRRHTQRGRRNAQAATKQAAREQKVTKAR
jgi:hypothetical protein